MENLAPAGNWDALRSAVAAGADAVYLGYAAYSARAGAGNFDEQQLRDAVRFAHLHHVRVHVTVNTLIKDGEMAGVVDVLRLLSEIRVDAVLVQDLGVLRMARRCFPDLPIHASTQMAIHNATGVRFCRNQGMTRAVLARECSAAEIALAAKRASKSKCSGMAHSASPSAGSACFLRRRRTKRQPRALRSALPPAVYLPRQDRGVALSARHLYARRPAGAEQGRRCVHQAGGAAQTPGIRRDDCQ